MNCMECGIMAVELKLRSYTFRNIGKLKASMFCDQTTSTASLVTRHVIFSAHQTGIDHFARLHS